MADDWAHAVHESPEGVRVNVEVVPNSTSPGFPIGYNPWRRRLQARVAAAPEDGKANQELLELAARFFDVPTTQVEVAQGATSRQKQLIVRELPLAAATARLREAYR